MELASEMLSRIAGLARYSSRVKAAVGEPIRDEVVRLRDGRALAYTESRDPHGRPVFLFHGTPHSRIWCPEPQVAAQRGVRVITVDRPGFGGSDPKDPLQPREHLDFWARTIPRASVTVWRDASHQGISKHWGEILDELGT